MIIEMILIILGLIVGVAHSSSCLDKMGTPIPLRPEDQYNEKALSKNL